MSLAGNYSIQSGLSRTSFLNIPFATNRLFAPVVVRDDLEEPCEDGTTPVWEILPAGRQGSNMYTVRKGGMPITIQDGHLRVYLIPDAAEPAMFSIEPAGGNQYHFHVPGQDSVWTVGTDSGDPEFGAPVEVAPLQGLPEQMWTLN